MKTVGIIGGLGAMAGAELYRKVVNLAQMKGAIEDRDFPTIFAVNVPFVDTNEFGIKNADRVYGQVAYYQTMARSLGCERIVIACNSIYADEEMCKRYKIDCGFKEHVLIRGPYDVILQSEHSRNLGMFHDVQRSIVNNVPQHLVDGWIREAMDGDNVRHPIVHTFGFKDRVLLACTELCIGNYPANYTNTLDLMAEYLLDGFKVGK